MRNTQFFIGGLMLVMLALIWLKFGPTSKLEVMPSPSPIASVTPAPSVSPSPFSTFTTDLFTLTYPTEASASAKDSGMDALAWSVYYMGETQKQSGRTQTELADGYAVTIDRFEVATTSAALSQAKTERKSTLESCGDRGATEVKSITFAKKPSYTYTVSCLGEAELIYFQEGDFVYRITNLTASLKDGDKAKYQATTQAILDSFQLTSQAKAE